MLKFVYKDIRRTKSTVGREARSPEGLIMASNYVHNIKEMQMRKRKSQLNKN